MTITVQRTKCSILELCNIFKYDELKYTSAKSNWIGRQFATHKRLYSILTVVNTLSASYGLIFYDLADRSFRIAVPVPVYCRNK